MEEAVKLPLISIITPAFNAAATLAETIQSVMAQTFNDWELIIIDDCSHDGTGAVAERFAAIDPRVRFIRRAENGGSAHTRNKGIAAATGQYLAFIDADDVWLPEKLAAQLAMMQETSSGITYHGYRRFSANGHVGRVLRGPKRMTFDTLQRQTAVGMLTVMIDRARTGDITFPTTVTCEDLALWLQLTKAGHDIVFFDADLARYRITPGAKSSRLLRNQLQVWRAYRHYGGLTRGQTIAAMLHHAAHGVWKRIF